jgi:hypothetical protein
MNSFKQISCIALIINCFFSALTAQDDVPGHKKIHPSFGINVGASVPFGGYSGTAVSPIASNAPNGEANAGTGFNVCLKGETRFFRHPVWSFSVDVGFTLHAVNTSKIFASNPAYNANNFRLSNNWIISILPGINYEKGKRIKVGGGLSAGLFLFNGWSSSSTIPQLNSQSSKVIETDMKTMGALGIKPNVRLIYQIQPKLHLIFSADFMLAGGATTFNSRESSINTSTGAVISTPFNKELKYSTTMTALNLNLGLRYVFHKWKY